MRVIFLPVDVGETEAEVAESGTNGNVGHRNVGSGAECLVAQLAFHEGQRAGHFFALPGNPGCTLFMFGAFGFEYRGCCGIAQTIGQRLPALHLGALTIRGGKELVVRGDVVDVFNNDPRIEQRGVVIKQQDRNLAQRIDIGNTTVFHPGGVDHEVHFDLFFCQHNSDLADEGAGVGADQLHCMHSE